MKFANSDYNKLWESREGRKIVDVILNTEGLIKQTYDFHLKKFKIDPIVNPTNHLGESTFTSYMREVAGSEYMDMRAPLGDTRTADKKGEKFYQGMIPDFAPQGFKETAMERYYKESNFEQFGDAALIAQYATDEIQRMVNDANLTLSYLAAKALSTGETVYSKGEGIHSAIYKSYIPEVNFVKAGAKVWSDTSALIINEMINIEKKFQDLWGLSMNMIWEIPQDIFDNCFLKNAQVKEWVISYNAMNNITLPQNMQLTEELVIKALAAHPSRLSQIVVIDQKSNKGVRDGWQAGNVVFRPAGYAGYIRKAAILDEQIIKSYGNNVNSYNFTPVLNGLGVIMNSVCVNGLVKEWHTDLFVKAIPTLDEFLYHVIVDTTTANS
jgi:hypothetical protein